MKSKAKPRMPSGPTADTLKMIAKAAALATSHTLAEVGRQLGKTQNTTFHKLQDACGIPHAEHVSLHQLRRTNITALWRVAPEAARLVAGHSSFRTTVNHYVGADSIMAEAVKMLPQPEAFQGGAA